MESDSIIKQRMLAIKSFIDQQPDIYLNMVHRAKMGLGIGLGFNSRTTSLAQGIMNEVFGDLIDGTREWDMEKLKLEQVLWMNLKSEISARVNKEKRYIPTPLINDTEDDGTGRCIDNLVNTQPEDVEGTIDAETMLAYCFDVILKDDEDAQIVFNEMLNRNKQKDIAADLGLTVRETEVKIRNIRRKISKELPLYMIKNLPEKLITRIIKQT